MKANNPTLNKTERVLEVRLAENQLEIERALALRYDVFNLEMGEGLPQSSATRKDRDEYDLYCHHLLVFDKTNDNKIVGTYRILTRENAKKGGRPKGTFTIEREKMKEYIATRIAENGDALVSVLLEKALTGDIPAVKELFDRGFGKATQHIDNPNEKDLTEVLVRFLDGNTNPKRI